MAKRSEVAVGRYKGLLREVTGLLGAAREPFKHGENPRVVSLDETRKRIAFACHRPDHEVVVDDGVIRCGVRVGGAVDHVPNPN